jgi:hypothetical protein
MRRQRQKHPIAGLLIFGIMSKSEANRLHLTKFREMSVIEIESETEAEVDTKGW